MNGVDAVLIATGNDFRAVEAGAHAYACRTGRYSALSRWRFLEGKLIGTAEIPLAVGIVGGQTRSHPWVPVLLRILGVESARELAEVIVSVGLGQNFAALRALVTEGIQKGHMAMHARAVALSAGATPEEVETVVEKLRKTGEITVENARRILGELRTR
jgi:hydroxymethylglutaryl-CoA reductase